MRIEILYFEGCPNLGPAVQRVHDVLTQLGIETEVNEVEVRVDDDPVALKFVGSPTVLIDGRDIDPDLRVGARYGFSCRTFGGAGIPSADLVELALREAAEGEKGDHLRFSTEIVSGQSAVTRHTLRGLSIWTAPVAVGAAILSSACCWLPLLLVAFGLSAGSLAGFFETVRPYFLAATVLFLGGGFYFVYFRKPACRPGDTCAVSRPGRQRLHRGALWVATITATGFVLFPYYGPTLIRAAAPAERFDDTSAVVGSRNAGAETRVFHVTGLTCATCAVTLERELAKLPGVNAARVAYEDSTATVETNSEYPPGVSLETAARRAGFDMVRWKNGELQ